MPGAGLHGETPKPRWRQKRCWYLLLAVIALITLFQIMFSGSAGSRGSGAAKRRRPELLPYFDRQFKLQQGELPIDEVHRRGLPHFGTVVLMYTTEADLAKNPEASGAKVSRHSKGPGQVLFLMTQRSKDVAVCPREWLLVGEHAHTQESPVAMALRGLREELGVFAAEEDVTHLCDTTFQHQFHDGKQENQRTHLTLVAFPTFQHIDLNSEAVRYCTCVRM